jgi:anti-sigma-K factor RskA
MDHDQLRELTGAYALGLLHEDERQVLEAHIRVCSECAREAEELIATVSTLPYAVQPAEPRADLRTRIVNAALAESRASAGTAATTRAAGAGVRKPNLLLPYGLAAAASIAAVLIGLYAYTLRERIGDLESRLRTATAAQLAAERTLVGLQADADRARQIEAILSAPDVRRQDLKGLEPAKGAYARAIWSPTRGLVFATAGLPRPPGDQVYQLWVVPSVGDPISVGLLSPDPDGRSADVIPGPRDVREGSTFAVTLEPAGGVPAPTGPMYLRGSP